MRLNELRNEALRIAVEHGFTDASPAEDIALMHSELSEALEDIRKGKPLNEARYEVKRPSGNTSVFNEYAVGMGATHTLKDMKPVGVPSEMADVIIRVLHFCGKHKIDIEKAVEEKMTFNEHRPFLHGKKF